MTDQREKDNASKRRLRRERKAARVCVICTEPAADGFVHCADCLADNRDRCRQKRRRDRRFS